MPSKLGVRSRLKGFFSHRDDASTQNGVIQQDDRHGQASTTALLVNASVLPASISALPTGSALTTRSASPIGSTLPTRSTLPASTSSAPTTLAERLWDQAYDNLKIRDAALVQAYEKILSRKLGGQGFDSPVTGSEQNIIAQNDTHTRRDQMRQLIHDGLEKTAKEAKVKEVIGTATEFIFAAKDIISSAVQAAPQAALAWTGVCVALELIQNPISATEANRNGIEYVIKKMDWYWELSSAFLKEHINDSSLSGVRRELETQVIDLYKELLTYEIKSVYSFYRNRGLVLLRDIVGLDDWNGNMQAIQTAEGVVQRGFAAIAELKTVSNLEQLNTHAKMQSTAQITKENQQCIKDLRLTDPSDDKKRIEQTKGGLLQESYTWILDNSEFQQWQDSKESRLLWIKGDPGKGKTMLLCGIINELNQQSNHSRFVSYFFCQATDNRLNNAAAVLRGLIYMLVNQHPSLISHLREKYDQAGGKLFEGPNAWIALSDVFTAILQDSVLKSTYLYLVVDALDECVSDFEKLLDIIVQASDTETRVKWIVSSRNWPQIEERLQLAEQKVKLSLELNAKSISNAVDIYIEKKVHQLSQLKKYDQKTCNQVKDYLSKNANDTFLWVALVCQNLQKSQRWNVLEMLDAFPPDLDSLYERMLKQVFTMENGGDVNLCKQILAVMMSVYRPLTLRELGSLVETRHELSIEDLKDIVGLCGSFLTIREDTVYFVHQSAKDHLSKNEAAIFSSDHGNVHHTIFSLSLQALKKTLKRNVYDLPYLGPLADDYNSMPDIDPLSPVRYSCVYWVDHLRESHTSGLKGIHWNDLEDDGDVSLFFRKHLLHWLEALSLLQNVSAGVISITVLEGLLETQPPNGELRSFLRDAHRFTLYNRRAIEMAPLQIYSSALAFSPIKSLVREAFHQEIPQWIQNRLDVEDYWSPCLQTLEGHTSIVNSVAFLANHRQIASGSGDTTIRIWDIATGVCIQTLKGHTASVNSVAALATGQVASGSSDATIKIWDIATGVCIQTLEGHTESVSSVAFSNSQQIISGSLDQTIKIWDITSGACVQTLKGHGAPIMSVAILANGQIASGSHDATIKIWDIATGVCIKTLEGHTESVSSVAFLNSQQIISGSLDQTIKIWDITSGACVQALKGHKDFIRSIAVLANGQIASGSDDKIIKIWDIAAGVCVQTLEGHGNLVFSVAALATGQIASGSNDRTIRIWDTAIRTNVQFFDSHSGFIMSTASSLDGRHVISGSWDETIKIWDVDTGACVRTLEGHTQGVSSLTFLKHGQVVSASEDTAVKIWDVNTGACLQTLEGHGDSVRSIASTEGGHQIASGSLDKTVKIWDVAEGVCIQTLDNGDSVYSVAFSKDAKQLASGSRKGIINIWDVATGALTRTLAGSSYWVSSVTFSADCRYVASCSSDDAVKVWDVAAGACIQTLDVGWVHHLSFDPTSNSRIYSSVGILDIDLNPTTVATEPGNEPPSQRAAVRGYGIDGSQQWITKDGKRVLWLPVEYRPSAAIVVGSHITLGCDSGRVFMMKFSEVEPDS